jgi:predicted metal-dependent hydrolase
MTVSPIITASNILERGLSGAEWEEAAETRAKRVVREELRRRRWKVSELERRAKGDREKVAIAACLRRETEVTVKWIAERLSMGTAGDVNNRMYRWRNGLLA